MRWIIFQCEKNIHSKIKQERTNRMSILADNTTNISIKPGTKVNEQELTTLNLGPIHPATHGIFQNILKINGETIIECEQTVGYIHRAFEKIAEHRRFYQVTPLTDRLNYCSAPIK